MTKTRKPGFSKKRRRGGRKTVKKRGGKRRSRAKRGGIFIFPPYAGRPRTPLWDRWK